MRSSYFIQWYDLVTFESKITRFLQQTKRLTSDMFKSTYLLSSIIHAIFAYHYYNTTTMDLYCSSLMYNEVESNAIQWINITTSYKDN